MNSLKLLTLSGILSATAHGALVVSYANDSEDFNTKVTNTTVFDFNSSTRSGYQTNVSWDTVGLNPGDPLTHVATYDQVWYKNRDQYGGAGNVSGSDQKYSTIGTKYVVTTTLTLAQSSAYFGFWWSAGDGLNVMEFKKTLPGGGETLVARFTTDSLLNALAGSPEYKGNPVTSFLNQNNTQSYAFVNFFGETGTTWDKIVFSNNGTSGFESDNHTLRVGAWGTVPAEVGQPYPGKVFASVTGNTVTVIPEPSAAILPLLGGLLFLGRRRRN